MKAVLYLHFAAFTTARHLMNFKALVLPETNVTSASSLSATPSPSTAPTSPAIQSSSATPTSSTVAASPVSAAAPTKVQFAGMNIAGLDFGCDIQSKCSIGTALDPLTKTNGQDQMTHFIQTSGLNTLRFPVSWQFLSNNKPDGSLDSAKFAVYDKLMQSCISGASKLCVIDLHNYGRFEGQIIGQGGPANDAFAGLWTQLAQKYKAAQKVAFGLMNEPHDLDVGAWAQTVQAAVTAIRNAGAQQMILLPGSNFSSAGAFLDNGSADALSKVKNPDGSVTNLIFDVHKYLDQDNSGTHTECTTNNIDTAFAPLATFLRDNKRTAFVTETGAGNTDSCLKAMCEQLDFLNQNADVYLGWIGWGAGGFGDSYELVETPVKSGNTLTDRPIVSQCVAGRFK